MKKLHTWGQVVFGMALICSSSVHATVRVIDFDTDAKNQAILNGQIIDDEYSDWGVTISSCNYNTDLANTSKIDSCNDGNGWQDTQSSYDTLGSGLDPDLEFELVNGVYEAKNSGQQYHTAGLPPEFNNRTNPGNVLILNEEQLQLGGQNANGSIIGSTPVYDDPNDQGSRAAGYFTLEFNTGVALKSIDFFDVEDLTPNQDPAFYAIQFFDENGNEFAQGSSVPLFPTDGEWTRLTYNVMGIYSIRINLPGSGAIDNIAFQTPTPPGSNEVNAPATLALLMVALGFIYRRRFAR